MKIALIGSSGFVGKNLYGQLKGSDSFEVYGISSKGSNSTDHQADITKPEIHALLDRLSPDLVLQSTKLRKSVDYYEVHREEARELELGGTKNLTEWVGKNKRDFMLISTDYVYAGESKVYDELSATKPVNFYGELKLEAEGLVKRLPNYTILRPTVIFGYEPGGNNFLMQMINAKENMRIPSDQISNPTDASLLAAYAKYLIKNKEHGLFVATGPETIGRYDFALMISEVFGLDKSLFQPVNTRDLGQIAKRPLYNGTNSSKIRGLVDFKVPSLRESLMEIKEKCQKVQMK